MYRPVKNSDTPQGVTHIQIKVKPGARLSCLTQIEGDTWIAQIKSPPVDDKANAELIALVARHFGCPRSGVRIRTGTTGRLKRVEVDV
jgi:uncharacterized protein YggU (UPF0235/DUF167 family)